MPFKFNPLTGQLDLVNASGAGSGNVTGIPPTTVNAIARWDDTTGTTIKNSPNTQVQDGGAIESMGFITKRKIDTTVTVHSGESWIAPSLEMQPGGIIVLESDSQLIIV